MWLSDFSNSSRPSLAAIAGDTLVYRIKFTTSKSIVGLYTVHGQMVGATEWNFGTAANWVVPSNQADTRLVIGYWTSLPLVRR
jgi:hypothetical protein